MSAGIWRTRLIYIVMSAFVAWHTVAMVLAPAPDNSVSAIALRRVFQPYLSLLKLDNPWDFFAPTVGKGTQLRYVIEDANGAQHTFAPTEELNWFHPSYFWLRAKYYAIMESPETFGDAFATMACRQHSALSPVSVTLLEVAEGDFWAAEHRDGKHPMDPEFITMGTLKHVKCPSS